MQRQGEWHRGITKCGSPSAMPLQLSNENAELLTIMKTRKVVVMAALVILAPVGVRRLA